MSLPLTNADEQAFIDSVGTFFQRSADDLADIAVLERAAAMGVFAFAEAAMDGNDSPSLEALGEIFHVVGRHLVAGPIVAQLLGCALLSRIDGDHADFLGGSRRVSISVAPELADSIFATAGAPVRFSYQGDDLVLEGRARFALDAEVSDAVVLLAEDDRGQRCWTVVELAAEGVTVQPEVTVDVSRRFASVEFRGVRLAGATRVQSPPLTADAVKKDLVLIAQFLAMDAAGVAQRGLERTADYVMQREQFGQPVGLFQAVQHTCATMLVKARSAHVALSECLRQPSTSEHWLRKSLAVRGYAVTAAVEVIEAAIQMHGGIGFTWEQQEHVLLRRVLLDGALVIDPAVAQDILSDLAFVTNNDDAAEKG